MTDSIPRTDRLLLLAAVLNSGAASSIYLSILPGIVRGLELTEAEGGLLVTSAALAFGLAAPWWGRRSETAGRVTTITIGLLGYAAASAVFATVMLVGLRGLLTGPALLVVLLVSRPLGGALAAAVPAASQAYLADTSTSAQRTAALALVGIASGLGMIVGPALGGSLAAFGLTVPLWAATALALATAVAVRARLTEPTRPADPDASLGIAPALSWRDPRPRAPLAAVATLFTAVAAVATTMGFLLQDRLGLSEQAASARTGAVLTAVGIGMVAVQVLVVRRYAPGPVVLLRAGPPVFAVGIVVLLLAPTTVVFLVAGLVMGAGAGLTVPGAMAAASLRVGVGDQGMLGGLTVAAQTFGFVVGPVLAGVLYQRSPSGPGVLAIVLLALVAGWALLGAPDRSRLPRPARR